MTQDHMQNQTRQVQGGLADLYGNPTRSNGPPPTLPAPPVVYTGLMMTGDPGPMFAALARAQVAFGEVKRTRTVKVTPRDSAPYTFNYAPLDGVLAAVSKSLNDNEIVLLQPLYEDGDGWRLRTVLGHSSGATIECTASIPWPERRWFDKNAQDWRTAKGSWQDFGSAVTYARRYMVGSLLGIAPEEDDDGNAASGNEREATDRTGPRANTQATPPASPSQAAKNNAELNAAEKPAAAPKVETKPEPAPKPASVPPPAQAPAPAPVAHDADGVVAETAPDLGKALAQEELSPRLQPITDEQNAQALKFFQSKMWPRLNPNTKKVEPVLFESRDVRQQWLREVMGIANPSENLTSKDQMAKVLEALEKLPAKAVA